jgi:hypothetical protein
MAVDPRNCLILLAAQASLNTEQHETALNIAGERSGVPEARDPPAVFIIFSQFPFLQLAKD